MLGDAFSRVGGLLTSGQIYDPVSDVTEICDLAICVREWFSFSHVVRKIYKRQNHRSL